LNCLLLAALVLITLDDGEGARVLVVLHHEPFEREIELAFDISVFSFCHCDDDAHEVRVLLLLNSSLRLRL
jgi:hypothetical protein